MVDRCLPGSGADLPLRDGVLGLPLRYQVIDSLSTLVRLTMTE